AGDALSMALQHAQEPIPRLPPELRHWQKFFDRALAKTPEERFPSAREMRAALERIPERASARWFGGRIGTAPAGAPRWPWFAAAARRVRLAAIVLRWRAEQAARGEAETPPLAAGTRPAPGGSGGVVAQAADSLDTFMRPLPQSPAERWISAAQSQIRQERWTTPAGDNAYQSLMTAVQADPAHPRLPAVAGQLVDALSRQAER